MWNYTGVCVHERALASQAGDIQVVSRIAYSRDPGKAFISKIAAVNILMLEDLDACICHFRQDANDVAI